MKIQTSHTLSSPPHRPSPNRPPEQGSGDIHTPSKARKALSAISRGIAHYLKPAAVGALPAAATATAIALGGPGAAAVAIMGTALVGGVAGAVAWTRDVGPIRAFLSAGLASAAGGLLGVIAGPGGVAVSGALAAGRQVVLDQFSD